MTNSQRLAAVRACFLAWLAAPKDGVPEAENSDVEILRETILIRNEFYCGRRFHTANHQAVWFIEEDELKIYGDNGQLACVLSGRQIDERVESAAPKPADDPPSESPNVIKMPPPVERDDDSDGDFRRVA